MMGKVDTTIALNRLSDFKKEIKEHNSDDSCIKFIQYIDKKEKTIKRFLDE